MNDEQMMKMTDEQILEIADSFEFEKMPGVYDDENGNRVDCDYFEAWDFKLLEFARAMYEKGRQDEFEYVAEMYADEHY